ncbi:MAG TPA: hypothetical protein DDZ88_21235 [Verrucomicrobiales bacterium]|nr:hypothetical protein [Verrucomicrobiales bacterium]
MNRWEFIRLDDLTPALQNPAPAREQTQRPRHGFHLTEDVVSDIGSGFEMDDYVMEKAVR